MTIEGIIILGHGSRREDANDEIREITIKLQKKNPDAVYQVAFWEFGKPSLVDAVEGLLAENRIEKIIIMPMFLTIGNHMHCGIPGEILRLKKIYPHVQFAFAGHLGPDQRIVEIAEDRIKDAKEL
ncbi:MAG: sirohydrochlorin chelatase [Peptococcales bacterium]|jgi:sirohydrochlorin ferrochelatase